MAAARRANMNGDLVDFAITVTVGTMIAWAECVRKTVGFEIVDDDA